MKKQIHRSIQNDSFIDELLCTQLSDKITIIDKGGLIESGKDQFKSELKSGAAASKRFGARERLCDRSR